MPIEAGKDGIIRIMVETQDLGMAQMYIKRDLGVKGLREL